MAVIEIKAATLPGFPYYFPYRTGVRLTATPDALGGFYLPTDTSNPLVTGGITSAATVLAPVDADTAVTATLTADSHVVHYVDAATATTATATVEVHREVSAEASQEITATATVVGFRTKLIDSDPTALSVTITAAARLDGVASSTTPAIAALSAALVLDAVGSADQGVFVLSDPEQLLDAAGSSDTTIGTGRPGEVSRGQDLDSDTLALIALIAAEVSLASTLDTALTVVSSTTGTILHTLYLDTALTVTAEASVTANNIAASLGVTADFTAEVQHEQVAAAALEVSADTLADTFGTRFATALLDLTADRSAAIRLDPGYQFYSDFTATPDATGLRIQYLQDVPTVAYAAVSGAVIRTIPTEATVVVTAGAVADSHVTRYAVADTTIAATGFADIQRETFATAELTGVAVPTGTGMRTRYLDAPVTTTTALSESLANLLGLMNTALTGEAQTSAAQQADLVAAGALPVVATQSATSSLAMLIQTTLEVSAGFDALLNAVLSGQATLTVLAHLPMLESLRTANVAAFLEVVGQPLISNISWVYFLDGQLDVQAATEAAVMYRRYGGNPMWLPFFYGGYGNRTL